MRAIEFKGQTKLLAPPENWVQGTGGVEIGALPVQAEVRQGVMYIKSVWRPSAEELAGLAAGACVVVNVLNTYMVPIALSVEQIEAGP